MDSQALMRIRDLQVSFFKRQVLRGINLDIPQQGVTVVMGPSGSGKSVLLKSLNRMNELESGAHTSGSVEIGGQNIYAADVQLAALRQKVGMVFQKPAVFNMSIYDNAAFAPRLYDAPSREHLDEIVEGVLRAATLWDEVKARLKKNAFTLTEGQQQRLCIARALAAEPEVLLMDEPTSELDSICTLRIEELVHNISRYRPVVLACDDVQQAARLAEQCVFMLEGQIVEAGEAERVINFPQDKRCESYVLGLMA